MPDFVTDNNIIAFFSAILNPRDIAFTMDMIPSFVRTTAYEEIVRRSDNDWHVDTETFYLDGQGTYRLALPKDKYPIVRLDAMSIIRKDGTPINLIVNQALTTRNVRYNEETGVIEYVAPADSSIEYGFDGDDILPKFPDGIKNIKLVGVFGTGSPAYILKMLQLYIMLRHMSYLDPGKYGVADIISETIGKYKYELSGKGGSSAGKRMGLDDMINYLFSTLPGSSLSYEAI